MSLLLLLTTTTTTKNNKINSLSRRPNVVVVNIHISNQKKLKFGENCEKFFLSVGYSGAASFRYLVAGDQVVVVVVVAVAVVTTDKQIMSNLPN
jgi:hypothetical protein